MLHIGFLNSVQLKRFKNNKATRRSAPFAAIYFIAPGPGAMEKLAAGLNWARAGRRAWTRSCAKQPQRKT